MFELPFTTALLLLGFPLFWVAYTVIFLAVTRKWDRPEKRTESDS
jgi:hypothetical protein